MGIFSRIKKSAPVKQDETKKEKPEAAKEEVRELTVQTPKTSDKKIVVTLVTPRVSEKAAMLSAHQTYVFDVPVSANKLEVRRAVEVLYGVKVEGVNTLRGIGKATHRGRISGRRNRWKKALVTLKKGQKIDLFVGV